MIRKPKRIMSKARAEFRNARAENLLALHKFEREQTRLLFYWVAVNNAIGEMKGRKMRKKKY
jgi:hypothetical protein